MFQNKLFRTFIVGVLALMPILGVMASPVHLLPSLALQLGLETVLAAVPPFVQVTSPVEGEALNRASFIVNGTADPGVEVKVFIDNSLAGSTAAGDQGIWSLEVGPLTEGDHTLYAQAADSGGNAGTTAVLNFLVDLTADPVTITYPADGTSANRRTIEGLAEPGARVSVFIYGTEATVTADASGYWVYEDPALPEGNLEVYAVATDRAGNVAVSPTCSFVLDTTRPKLLPDIFPRECATQVPLDTVIRVYLAENSVLDPELLSKAINLWPKGNPAGHGVNGPGEVVSGTVYTAVSGTVFGDVYGTRLDPCLELTFVPDVQLAPATTYMVAVDPEITDAAGNPVYPRQWFFSTAGGETTPNPHGNYIENVNVCINCHTPHRARSPEIVEPYGQESALIDDYCQACHDGTAAPLPDNWGKMNRHDYKLSREGTSGPSACTACHDPHLRWSPENPNLLQDFYFFQHNDPTNPYLPNNSQQALCELCHESSIHDDPRVAYEQYRYNRWHTSTGPTGNYSLCLGCHDGGIAYDIKSLYTGSSRHVLQARDGSKLYGPIPCSDCHETHGSDNPRLLKGVLGHNRVRDFQTQDVTWDAATERVFCTGCHNNSTELYGVVAGFVYDTPGHEPTNPEACSTCHGGTPQAAAHAPQ